MWVSHALKTHKLIAQATLMYVRFYTSLHQKPHSNTAVIDVDRKENSLKLAMIRKLGFDLYLGW